jgi:hypothetical protein
MHFDVLMSNFLEDAIADLTGKHKYSMT